MSENPNFESLPPSFADGLADSYLGNPDTVRKLVAVFTAGFEALLIGRSSEEVSKEDFVRRSTELVRGAADVFSGRNANFRTVVGYHEHTLPNKLKADLGPFYLKHHGDWGDDPVCVLFAWLGAMVFDAMSRSQGDDDVLGVLLRPSVQYAVGVLLGTEKRAMP